jgi:hypothetical protein
MKTREQALRHLHVHTQGVYSDNMLGGAVVLVKDLLAVLEFCGVVGDDKQPSTIAEAREAAIKAGDIAPGKRAP